MNTPPKILEAFTQSSVLVDLSACTSPHVIKLIIDQLAQEYSSTSKVVIVDAQIHLADRLQATPTLSFFPLR